MAIYGCIPKLHFNADGCYYCMPSIVAVRKHLLVNDWELVTCKKCERSRILREDKQ